MGGSNSGRREYGRKGCVEDCLTIDIGWMRRRGLLWPGASGMLNWTNRGEPIGDIRYRTEREGLVLNFRYRWRGGEWETVQQPLPIEWTPCRFGGKRPWFRCPGVIIGKRCGRRVLMVHAGGKFFLCRHCYGLAHRCQSESQLDRLLRRADKTREALGGSYHLDEPPPPKPKGMHWRTYRWREEAIERADEDIERAFQSRFGYSMCKTRHLI